MYKRARVLGLEGAAPPPPKCQTKDAATPGGATQVPVATRVGLATRRRTPTTSARAGTAARYEQLAFTSAPWRDGEVVGRTDRHERGTLGHALSQADLTAWTASRGEPRETCHGGDEGIPHHEIGARPVPAVQTGKGSKFGMLSAGRTWSSRLYPAVQLRGTAVRPSPPAWDKARRVSGLGFPRLTHAHRRHFT